MTASSFHTWVINLDRAPQRLQRIGARLDALGLPWTRQPAVEGRLVSPQQRAQTLDEAGFARLHGMPPVPGELGCYLSHLEVMRAFLASAHPLALVLEDDVQPTAALPEVLQALAQAAERWDMAKLSAIHSGTPQPVLHLAHGHHLCVMLSRCTGSSAYVINRRAAQRYLEVLLPMQLPYDHAYDRGWRYGLKVRRVSPEVCEHDAMVESTIATPGPTRKFHWSRRLPAFVYRLGNELQRLAYGLRHWLLVR